MDSEEKGFFNFPVEAHMISKEWKNRKDIENGWFPDETNQAAWLSVCTQVSMVITDFYRRAISPVFILTWSIT